MGLKDILENCSISLSEKLKLLQTKLPSAPPDKLRRIAIDSYIRVFSAF